MKCVILAGGMKSTLTRTGELLPKPMIDVGGKPLLWHIMKHFSEFGISEFIICGGYKIDVIKEYFVDFYIYASDITIDLANNSVVIHNNKTEDWRVVVLDTGIESSVIDRIKKVEEFVEEDFIVTYGDCLSDINVDAMIKQHIKEGVICTLAVAKPRGRKQLIELDDVNLHHTEFSGEDNYWVNSDCYILNKSSFSMMNNNSEESQLFKLLNKHQKLSLYKHSGYWTTIETMRDLIAAEELWEKGVAPWIKRK